MSTFTTNQASDAAASYDMVGALADIQVENLVLGLATGDCWI